MTIGANAQPRICAAQARKGADKPPPAAYIAAHTSLIVLGEGGGGGPKGPPPFDFLELRLRALTPLEQSIWELVEPAAGDVGCRVVRVRVTGMKHRRVQIMVERSADGGCGIEDCERVSRAISALLDVADPIEEDYDLEVSSPGVDRPLMRLEDFARYIGHEAKLETLRPVEGRRRWRGEIAGVEGDGVVIRTDAGVQRLALADLGDARLILTDKLIEEDLKRVASQAGAAHKDLEEKRT